MDNKAYLASISAPAPVKQPSVFRKYPGIFRILIIASAIIISFVIFSSFFSRLENRIPSNLGSIVERSDKFKTLLEKYHKNLKSSDLRSYNSTLIGVISDLSVTTKKFRDTEYKAAGKFTLEASEVTRIETINSELETARISDLLDRRYPLNISFYLSLLLSSIKELRTQTKNHKDFASDLLRFINNLESIQSDFNSYSNPTT